MPVRNNSITSFQPQMLRNTEDNCDCICEGVCSHDKSNEKNNEVNSENMNKSTINELNQEKINRSLFMPPPLLNSYQIGIAHSLLYSGSKFGGFQKSKGNSYEVEVSLKVIKTDSFVLNLIFYFEFF